MTETTLGRRIAQRRRMLSLSQEAFGEKMGVSRQAISKWEADAAIPEVDRLIEMSRLFDVSVGWLLGTEAENSPTVPQEEDLSEQITQAFQPFEPEDTPQPPPPVQQPPAAPKKRHERWLLPVCAIVTACSLAVSAVSLSVALSRPTQTVAPSADTSVLSDELDALSERIAAVESNIVRLDGRVDLAWEEFRALTLRIHDLEQAPDNSATDETLPGDVPPDATEEPTSPQISPHIQDWSLTGTCDLHQEDATLTFRCTAATQLTGATLSVMQDDKLVTEAPCQSEGQVWSAQTTIPLNTGYRYYITLDLPDGTSEAATLEGHGLSDLYSGYVIPQLSATLSQTPFGNYTTQRIWAGYDSVILTPPPMTSPDAKICWQIDQISYYYNNEQADYHSLLGVVDPELLSSTVLNFQIPTQTFDIPAFQEGDTHEFVLHGSIVIDGVSFHIAHTLSVWTVQNGELVLTQQGGTR